MRTKKSRFESLAISFLFAVFGLTGPSTAAAGPTETVSLTDKQVTLLESRTAQSPDSIPVRNSLARAYIQKARENGDASFFTLAESLLTKNLEKEPGNGEAIGLRAWVSLFKHEFKDAARWAEKGVSQSPKSSFYYGLLSDAHLEMGNYDEAVGYAQKMVDLRPDQGSYSRAAYLRSIYGDSPGAIKFWSLAIRSGAPAAENTAWCQVELGDEYFNRGKLAKAEEAYRTSLKTFPGYHRGLAGLGKVRAAQKQWDESAQFYRRAAGVIPYPQYVSALGDVYTEMQKRDEAQKQYDLVEYIAKINRVNQVLYNRDLALFYADHNANPDEALRLAQKEFEVRKDIYTYDILAWAYFQNKRYPEAERAIDQAMKLGTRDARIFFHAGMIASALGNRKTARNYLTQALSINPYFPYRNRAEAVLKGVGS